MRISDWSSDVCSSDLSVDLPAPLRPRMARRSPSPISKLTSSSNRVSRRLGGSKAAPRNRSFQPEPERSRCRNRGTSRSEEHTSELQSLMRISYAVFCLKKKKLKDHILNTTATKN